MPTATDDSGTAAMSVSEHLRNLRAMCDSMNIKWHWRHKESTLERMIEDKRGGTLVNVSAEEVTDAVIHAGEIATPVKREVPQDVLDALDYCNGYHRGNTKCIRAYIEEIR